MYELMNFQQHPTPTYIVITSKEFIVIATITIISYFINAITILHCIAIICVFSYLTI